MTDANQPQLNAAIFAPPTIGQILDRVFHLFRSRVKLFVGIALVPSAAALAIIVVTIPIVLVPVLREFPKQPNIGGLLFTFIPLFLLLTLINGVVMAIYLAAACHAAMQANLGLKITFRDAYRKALEHWKRYALLILLCYVYSFLPALIVELAFAASTAILANGATAPNPALLALFPVGMLLFVAALIYGIFVALRLSLAFPACVAEGLTASAAIKRSTLLTRGAKGRIFLVLLVVYAASYLLFMVVYAVVLLGVGVGAFTAISMHMHQLTPGMYVGIGVAGFVFLAAIFFWTALAWAGYSTAFAVLYHDQRFRIEGPAAFMARSGAQA